jgi:hypothetical protein
MNNKYNNYFNFLDFQYQKKIQENKNIKDLNITIWNEDNFNHLKKNDEKGIYYKILSKYIDELGEKSKTAQKLGCVLTSVQKIINSKNNETLFLYTDLNEEKPIAILKIGTKKLFHRVKIILNNFLFYKKKK